MYNVSTTFKFHKRGSKNIIRPFIAYAVIDEKKVSARISELVSYSSQVLSGLTMLDFNVEIKSHLFNMAFD